MKYIDNLIITSIRAEQGIASYPSKGFFGCLVICLGSGSTQYISKADLDSTFFTYYYDHLWIVPHHYQYHYYNIGR